MIGYICKYTPIHILESFGEECIKVSPGLSNFEKANCFVHSTECTYVKAILESLYKFDIDSMVLINCCDSVKRLYDVLNNDPRIKFLYLIDLPRTDEPSSVEYYKAQLINFIAVLETYSGKKFNLQKFLQIIRDSNAIPPQKNSGINIALMGTSCPESVIKQIETAGGNLLNNYTCTGEKVKFSTIPVFFEENKAIEWYSHSLLGLYPCMRMKNVETRMKILNENSDLLSGIVYHTIKYCDMNSYELSMLKKLKIVPVLKIESNYTNQGNQQIKTSIEKFMKSLKIKNKRRENSRIGKKSLNNVNVFNLNEVTAGIDIGLTSTNVVILDGNKNMISYSIINTCAKSIEVAYKALAIALKKAKISREQLSYIVSTGRERVSITFADEDVTEITCHGKAALFLDNSIRTIIDISEQGSKVIKLDHNGNLIDFVMNGKFTPATGSFLELTEKSIADNTAALVERVGGASNYMISGEFAKNKSVVKAIEEKLNKRIFVPYEPQIVGALGAALIAFEKVKINNGLYL